MPYGVAPQIRPWSRHLSISPPFFVSKSTCRAGTKTIRGQALIKPPMASAPLTRGVDLPFSHHLCGPGAESRVTNPCEQGLLAARWLSLLSNHPSFIGFFRTASNNHYFTDFTTPGPWTFRGTFCPLSKGFSRVWSSTHPSMYSSNQRISEVYRDIAKELSRSTGDAQGRHLSASTQYFFFQQHIQYQELTRTFASPVTHFLQIHASLVIPTGELANLQSKSTRMVDLYQDLIRVPKMYFSPAVP